MVDCYTCNHSDMHPVQSTRKRSRSYLRPVRQHSLASAATVLFSEHCEKIDKRFQFINCKWRLVIEYTPRPNLLPYGVGHIIIISFCHLLLCSMLAISFVACCLNPMLKLINSMHNLPNILYVCVRPSVDLFFYCTSTYLQVHNNKLLLYTIS